MEEYAYVSVYVGIDHIIHHNRSTMLTLEVKIQKNLSFLVMPHDQNGRRWERRKVV